MATTAFVSSNGDIIRWEIPVTNNGSQADTNVTVTGAYPAGVLYTTHTPVAGTTFDSSTPEWVIPTLPVGATKTLVVFTKVTDITLAPFVWTLTVDGDNVDVVSGNNELELTVETTTCPPSAGAVDDPNACLCGNVTTNDTLCSSGTTEVRLGTTTNLHEDFELGVDGSYNANGMLLDPFTEATFTYSIWCIVGEDEFETSGPATVTIPALFLDTFTDSLVDNEDGTYTHTSLDGTVTIINLNSVQNVDTVYPTTITEDTVITELTLRNFTKIDDSGGETINITIPDPADLGLDEDTTLTWTFKRINDWDSGVITITADNSKLIDGDANYVFEDEDKLSITFWTDGDNYFIK